MIKVLLYIWQLPQNILSLLVILFTGAKRTSYEPVSHWLIKNPDNTRWFGVCLGDYIIFGNWPDKTSCQHEQGHQKQSRYLGPLYLLIIGLPSALGNMWDRLFHKKWIKAKRISWYYSLPWEKWADKLGGVERRYT